MLREPAVIAKGLLVVYATGVLVILTQSAWGADTVLRSGPLLAWVVGPAALATLLVARTESRDQAWLFVGAEAAIVSSTVWLWSLLFVNTGSQNAQSGIAMLLLPFVQLAALLFVTSGVMGAALILRTFQPGYEEPISCKGPVSPA